MHGITAAVESPTPKAMSGLIFWYRSDLGVSISTPTFTNGSEFDQWTQTNVSVSANTTDTTAPDGSNNADKIFDNGVNSSHNLSRAATNYTINVPSSCEISFKAGTIVSAAIGFGGPSTYINLVGGTFASLHPEHDGKITSQGNDWYKVRLSIHNPSDGTINLYCIKNGAFSYAGTGEHMYVSGAKIEQTFSDVWRDQSGNNYHLSQSTLANRFYHSASVHRGIPAMSASNASRYFWTSFGATYNQPGTTIVVVRCQPDPADVTRVISDGISLGNRWSTAFTTGPILGYSAGTSAIYAHAGTGTPNINIAGGAIDAIHYYRVEFNGASSRIFRDSNTTALATGNPGANPLTGISLGADQAGTPSFKGLIFEYIGFNKILNAREVEYINNYLSERYGQGRT